MKHLIWIAVILFIAVVTLHAMADDETQAQRDQSAKAAMEEARKAYNIKSDDEKYDESIQEQHDDDRAAQQCEF